jgi:hypothetical protein
VTMQQFLKCTYSSRKEVKSVFGLLINGWYYSSHYTKMCYATLHCTFNRKFEDFSLTSLGFICPIRHCNISPFHFNFSQRHDWYYGTWSSLVYW